MNALVWSTKASCWIKHRSCWVNSYFWRTANRDRKLAERRLEEFKSQIGCLSLGDDSRLGFAAVAHRWLESVRHTLAPGTIQQREIRIKNIAPFFKGSSLRNITPAQCERWAI
jgi:hypothetical protein